MEQPNLTSDELMLSKTKALITHTLYGVMNYVTHLSLVIHNSWKFRKIFIELLETENFLKPVEMDNPFCCLQTLLSSLSTFHQHQSCTKQVHTDE